jgi:hypothetical protein
VNVGETRDRHRIGCTAAFGWHVTMVWAPSWQSRHHTATSAAIPGHWKRGLTSRLVALMSGFASLWMVLNTCLRNSAGTKGRSMPAEAPTKMVSPPVPPSAVGRGTADTRSEVLSRQLWKSGKLCWTLVSTARSTARCNSGFACAATAAQVAARGLDNMSTRLLEALDTLTSSAAKLM